MNGSFSATKESQREKRVHKFLQQKQERAHLPKYLCELCLVKESTSGYRGNCDFCEIGDLCEDCRINEDYDSGDSQAWLACKNCYEEMSQLKNEIKIEKIEFKIDKYHIYTIARYGPVIKCIKDGDISFKSVKKDLNIEKLKNGEYKLEDILNNECKSNDMNELGMYPENTI